MVKGSKFGAKPKGIAKYKGAKGRRVKDKNKVKTKVKTANRSIGRRQQKSGHGQSGKAKLQKSGQARSLGRREGMSFCK
jgi:hypothetical protein